MDLLPFRNRGDQAEDEEQPIEVDHRLSHCLQQDRRLRRVRDEPERDGKQVDKGTDQSQQHRRHNCHQHVKAGEVPAHCALKRFFAVFCKDLVKALAQRRRCV